MKVYWLICDISVLYWWHWWLFIACSAWTATQESLFYAENWFSFSSSLMSHEVTVWMEWWRLFCWASWQVKVSPLNDVTGSKLPWNSSCPKWPFPCVLRGKLRIFGWLLWQQSESSCEVQIVSLQCPKVLSFTLVLIRLLLLVLLDSKWVKLLLVICLTLSINVIYFMCKSSVTVICSCVLSEGIVIFLLHHLGLCLYY